MVAHPVSSLQPARAVPEELCPTCGQPISHLKAKEIAHLEARKEKERVAAVAGQVAHAVQEAEARMQSVARAQLAKASKEFSEREVTARAEAKAQAEAALTPKLATATKQLGELTASRQKDLQTARAEGKAQAEVAFAPRLAEAEAARKHLTELKASHAKELQITRAAVEKDADRRLSAEKANRFRSEQKLQSQVAALQRQLEHKTADELGEGAEIDLFETLKAEFTADDIKRIGKGEAGADIVHKVMHNGRECGTILYDSKNRRVWRNSYQTKLRADKLAYPADHAVLSTGVFPRGVKQIDVRGGVVIANPARVVAIVRLLRDQIVQADTLRLSARARDKKAAELYGFITSDRCAQLMDQIEADTAAIAALDVDEMSEHNRTWRKRGQLVRSVERAHADLVREIDRVIGTAPVERTA